MKFSVFLLVIALGIVACDDTVNETPQTCGNGVLDPEESCDGTQIGSATCVSLGFSGGELTCTNACEFDTSKCETSHCGDDLLDAGESCDGTNLNGATCESLGFDGGILGCLSTCEFDASGCEARLCGNGMLDAGESCDGTNLNGATCESFGFNGGTLGCSSTCEFDTSGCEARLCGNGMLDAGESCDGTNLNGATCESLGFDEGTLTCSASCTIEAAGCIISTCGNEFVEGQETCDGTAHNGATCESLGFVGGGLWCMPNCLAYDTSGCHNCGNGVADTEEECDGADLAGNSCINQGFSGGTLGCTWDCHLDYSTCNTCGNGVVDSDEVCDGADLDGASCLTVGGTGGTLACAGDCQYDLSGCTMPVCGDGTVEGTEQCDVTDLDGEDCISLGFDSGILACTSSCTFNTSACVTDPFCGDGNIDLGEECDGTEFGGAACTTLGYYFGTLACTGSCELDTANCEGYCGDLNVDWADGEDCDGTWSYWNCQDYGNYYPAQVPCINCQNDLSSCMQCGDGIISPEYGEECDGGNLGGETCASQGFPLGGTLACTNCHFDTTGCDTGCGNGILDPLETCDGSQFAASYCNELGYFGGTRGSCGANCSSVSGCDPWSLGTNCLGECRADTQGNLICFSDAADVTVSKYSIVDATTLWTVTYTEDQIGTIELFELADDDQIYILGDRAGGIRTIFQATADGTPVRNIDAPGAAFPFSKIRVRDGHIAVCGTTSSALPGESNTGGTDTFVALYSAVTGVLQWNHHAGLPEDDSCRAVGLDTNGNLIAVREHFNTITIHPNDDRTIFDYVRFDPTGAFAVQRRFFQGTIEEGDYTNDWMLGQFAIDSHGHVFATGRYRFGICSTPYLIVWFHGGPTPTAMPAAGQGCFHGAPGLALDIHDTGVLRGWAIWDDFGTEEYHYLHLFNRTWNVTYEFGIRQLAYEPITMTSGTILPGGAGYLWGNNVPGKDLENCLAEWVGNPCPTDPAYQGCFIKRLP